MWEGGVFVGAYGGSRRMRMGRKLDGRELWVVGRSLSEF